MAYGDVKLKDFLMSFKGVNSRKLSNVKRDGVPDFGDS